MADKIVLLDTSILIDFFRKTDKSKSKLISIVDMGFDFCISAITEYEIYTGATAQQDVYWKQFLRRSKVLAFDSSVVEVAVAINKVLKNKRKQIDLADLFIAATAVSNKLQLATLNKKHFDRIENLMIIE